MSSQGAHSLIVALSLTSLLLVVSLRFVYLAYMVCVLLKIELDKSAFYFCEAPASP